MNNPREATPGPWHAVRLENGTWAVCSRDILPPIGWALSEKDAYLMAAAPDLLELVKSIMTSTQVWPAPILSHAMRVVTKARGDRNGS